MAALPPSTTEKTSEKRKKIPFILGLTLAIPAAGGGFWVASQDVIPSFLPPPKRSSGALSDISYVPLDPVLVTLAPGARSKHLRLTAQIEVPAAHHSEVMKLRPRISDMMNSYLSALSLSDVEAQPALVRLRAHLLRRITLIAGADRVRDLLITEFVLN